MVRLPDDSSIRRRPVRLIASDLDGTLFGPEHALTPRTIAAVQAAVGAGIHVIAATGRSTTSAVPRLAPVEVIGTAVCSNGSLIHDLPTGHTTDRFPIDPAMVERLFACVSAIDDRFAFCWETDHGNGWDDAFDDIAFVHEDLGEERGLARRPIMSDRTTKIMVRHPEIEQEELREFLEGRLARFKLPRYLQLSGEPLPRTASGKILKRDLRQRAAQRLGEDLMHGQGEVRG